MWFFMMKSYSPAKFKDADLLACLVAISTRLILLACEVFVKVKHIAMREITKGDFINKLSAK